MKTLLLTFLLFLSFVSLVSAQELPPGETTFEILEIDFEILVPEKIVATIGEPTEVRIDIKNTGTLSDSYNISLALYYPEYALISPDEITTQTAETNEIVTAYSTLTILLDKPNFLNITVSSNTNSSITKETEIEIKTGSFALPEFHLLGLIQIIVLSTIVFFFVTNKKPKSSK